MDLERAADGMMVMLPIPVALLMVAADNYVSAAAMLVFSVIAAARLASPSVRTWTDENQWTFLGVLVFVMLLAGYDFVRV